MRVHGTHLRCEGSEGSEGSKGSEGKVDDPSGRGLWPPAGGRLCPHRGNDSLHFVRRSAPSKCVRCASLRSGGRRLAVRKTIEYQIGALPRTPFPAAREFAPVGSMSLDSRVAWLPYESSSFATSRGNERYEEKNRGVICFMYYSSNPPLVSGATTFPPLQGGTTTCAYCRAAYEESVSRCFILPPER